MDCNEGLAALTRPVRDYVGRKNEKHNELLKKGGLYTRLYEMTYAGAALGGR